MRMCCCVQAIARALGHKLCVLRLVNWRWEDRQYYPAHDIQHFNSPAGGEDGGLDTLTYHCENLRELVIHATANIILSAVPRAWFERRLGCLKHLDLGRIILDAPLRVAELPRLQSLACVQLPDFRPQPSCPAYGRVGIGRRESIILPPLAWPTSLRIYDSAYSDAAVRDWALSGTETPFGNALTKFEIAVGPSSQTCSAEYRYADDAIRTICETFPRLKHLELRDSAAAFTPDTMAALRSLNIEYLSLADASYLQAQSLAHLPITLTYLDLSGCSSLLQCISGENLYHLDPQTAADRFMRGLVAPLKSTCPRARLHAHIELSYQAVLCTDFRAQNERPHEYVCPQCFWRLGANNVTVGC